MISFIPGSSLNQPSRNLMFLSRHRQLPELWLADPLSEPLGIQSSHECQECQECRECQPCPEIPRTPYLSRVPLAARRRKFLVQQHHVWIQRQCGLDRDKTSHHYPVEQPLLGRSNMALA